MLRIRRVGQFLNCSLQSVDRSLSDILAELDLQQSGILELDRKSKKAIRLPQKFDLDAPQQSASRDRVGRYYDFQIHLRRTLNTIQSLLYPQDGESSARRIETLLYHRHESHLAIYRWRKLLTQEMRWEDNRYLTDDILDARLREKYYGAVYVVNLPLLEYAIHKMQSEITEKIRSAVLRYREVPLQQRTRGKYRVIDEMEV